ncbi:MAG TPA: ABC transporter ATP-binding protein [Stellaceae bacterium]|nr:ABC transporter ATP-binding protein [Stellaceae bacterium]
MSEMSQTALLLEDLRKSFGVIDIIRGVTLRISTGERHAIIGPNGAGKSTLFNLISGRLAPTGGRISLDGQRIDGLPPYQVSRRGLSRSFQITNVFPRLTVFENIRCAVLRELGYGLSIWRRIAGRADVVARCSALLDEIGLSSVAQAPADTLSYAELRALELGITIAGGARVILLDEPTAGMSRPETSRTLELIRGVSAGRTLVIVEHDMAVVFGLADRISVLVYGRIIATGTPAEIRANAEVQAAYLGATPDAGALPA